MRLPAFLLAAALLPGCSDPAAMAALNQAAQVLLADGRPGASPTAGGSAAPPSSTVPWASPTLPGATTPPGATLPSRPSTPTASPMLPGLGDLLKTLPTGLSAGDPTADEQKLYELLMAYRADKGLPRIPRSRSLTIVAQTHAQDLQAHPPDEDKGCNMHSWSANGAWKAVCYTDDHAKAEGMWRKPSELTRYTGNGYEIAYGAWGSPVDPQGALEGWQGSPGHNKVIINAESWADNEWKAVGVGITANYAVTWFGEEPDPTP